MARDDEKQTGPGFLGRLLSRSDRRAGATKAGGDSFDTPEKAYVEAERRIERARRSGATELVLGNLYSAADEAPLQRLERLPPSIAGLTAVQNLYLAETQISDLAPIAGLTGLRLLTLHSTEVADLTPIARHTALQRLSLDGTPVVDLAPIAGLTALRTLCLSSPALGQVADLAPIAGLTALQTLYLQHTQIADLAPLAGLTALQTLYLNDTPVADLSPIAGLTALQSLKLAGTQVADLAPIAALTALQSLELAGTQVADLAPLAGLTALQTLYLASTQVADLAPIAGLTALQRLILDGTQIADLGPIAGLTRLSSAADPYQNGVHFGATPVSRTTPFDALVSLKQPASTVETINYLRRQQGLPEFIPEGYVRPERFVPPEVVPQQPEPEELPDPDKIPQQAASGLLFGGSETGPIQLVSPPGETPQDNAAQREFYAEIKDKAAALIEACGSSNRLGRTRQMAERLVGTMGQELPQLQERLFWSRMNTLRRASEHDRRAREARDPETPPMPEDVAVHLDDLVDTLNVFASGDARLVEIDHQSIDPALRIATEELTKAAREIAEAARGETRVIDREAAEVLDEVAADAVGQSPSADRAREFSVRSSRNLALELLRRAYRVVRAGAQKGSGWAAGAIAGSVIGGIGGAQFVDFIARLEPLIRGIIRDLPAQETLTTILNLILRIAP
jgi:Leucine-rich repeat (LRR) protein